MLDAPRRIGPLTLSEKVRTVSYATRGMESMRGFDIFMRFAKRLGDLHPDVQFIVAGQDRVCYGDDRSVTGGKSFKEWVLSQVRDHAGSVRNVNAANTSGPSRSARRPGPSAPEKTRPIGGRSQWLRSCRS